ncbi:hypothetical protein I2F27_01570 [Acinetobacter sp. B5B]|uniref:hypothetical protein n=1 Tax=Acinetobacter baretiae TaxID=2605383 RepID=UPI0018C2CB9A|nr:hypothetical protein [Acinetobacter baretiae]MBF7682027.1 hypothetical protein [Acinetobacter baretiae]
MKYKKIFKFWGVLIFIFICIKFYSYKFHLKDNKEDDLLRDKLDTIFLNKENVNVEVIDNSGQYFCIVWPGVNRDMVNYNPFKYIKNDDKEKILSVVREPIFSLSDMNSWLIVIDKDYQLKRVFRIDRYFTTGLSGRINHSFFCSKKNEPMTSLLNPRK